MEDFTPLAKVYCTRSYKEGFFEKLAELNELALQEKQAAINPFSAGAKLVGGGLAALAPLVNLAMWLPPAAVTGGALLGATTALATAPFAAQQFEQEREMRRLNTLMRTARETRAERSRYRSPHLTP